MQQPPHLVISNLLFVTGWNLRQFCDWMSIKGYELGQHYHWYWHSSNGWAITVYDEQVAIMMALTFPERKI